MKNMILIAVIGLVPYLYAQTDWQPLFNGHDLSNWHVIDGTAEFRVQDDMIIGVSHINTPNTFLATNEEFSDFILEYEAMMDDGLNSGVQIRSLSRPDYNQGRLFGYQVELDATARAWTAGIYDESRRGWLYNLECNPEAKKAYKSEKWNKFRVEAIGSHIRVWLNNVPTADVVDDVTAKGVIALQVHSIGEDRSKDGKMVRFRNIRILTSDPGKEATPETDLIPQQSYLTNRLTGRETREGWRLLWDGKTTKGWRGAKLSEFPEKGWKIDNGILSVEPAAGEESANGGDIITVDQYGNFILSVDFKFTEGSNSGIKYFVDPDLNQGEGSAIGCEYQILDDAKHPDAGAGADGNRTLASLYDLIPANAFFYAPHEQVAKRVNNYNWNRATIVVEGDHVEHYLNGIKVVQYERRTQMWKALVARSKYAVWPAFGETEKGHILLQDHGDQVFFKNIKIKVLD
jgi:hypothetical protein